MVFPVSPPHGTSGEEIKSIIQGLASRDEALSGWYVCGLSRRAEYRWMSVFGRRQTNVLALWRAVVLGFFRNNSMFAGEEQPTQTLFIFQFLALLDILASAFPPRRSNVPPFGGPYFPELRMAMSGFLSFLDSPNKQVTFSIAQLC